MVAAIDQIIEGKKLEESQKKAVEVEGQNVCVNAGAGSGKTFTILAKVLHLLDKKLANQEEIIVVAYNTRVAAELRDRIYRQAKLYPNLEKQLKGISISEGKECPKCNKKIESALHMCTSEKKSKKNRVTSNY